MAWKNENDRRQVEPGLEHGLAPARKPWYVFNDALVVVYRRDSMLPTHASSSKSTHTTAQKRNAWQQKHNAKPTLMPLDGS